eukprot:SAG22_NODE_1017_length_6016_cov_40.662667_3_plen_135_part_00
MAWSCALPPEWCPNLPILADCLSRGGGGTTADAHRRAAVAVRLLRPRQAEGRCGEGRQAAAGHSCTLPHCDWNQSLRSVCLQLPPTPLSDSIHPSHHTQVQKLEEAAAMVEDRVRPGYGCTAAAVTALLQLLQL